MNAEVGNAELAPAQLLADVVGGTDVLHGSTENRADGGRLVLRLRGWSAGLGGRMRRRADGIGGCSRGGGRLLGTGLGTMGPANAHDGLNNGRRINNKIWLSGGMYRRQNDGSVEEWTKGKMMDWRR